MVVSGSLLSIPWPVAKMSPPSKSLAMTASAEADLRDRVMHGFCSIRRSTKKGNHYLLLESWLFERKGEEFFFSHSVWSLTLWKESHFCNYTYSEFSNKRNTKRKIDIKLHFYHCWLFSKVTLSLVKNSCFFPKNENGNMPSNRKKKNPTKMVIFLLHYW